MKKKKLPIGVSDFKVIVSEDYYYVDKTLFIKEIIDKGDKILLIPRPRRFGKTLNISMLKYFYDCCPQSSPANSDADKKLFSSLAIGKAGKDYLDKQGKYPVIFLSFRDIKELAWETCLDKLKQLIQDEYGKHYYLLKSKKLIPHEKDYFKQIIERKSRGVRLDKETISLLVNSLFNPS